MDDPIFETDDAATAAAAGSAAVHTDPPAPNGSDPAPAPVVDNSAMDARMGRIEEGMQSMTQFFTSLQERMESIPPNQGAGAPAAAAAEPEDFNTRFYADPQKAIQDTVQEQTAGVVHPAAQTIGDMIISQEQAKIDGKWGEGAWDTHIKPVLDPVLNEARRQNPAQLFNRTAIENAVGSILARNIDGLIEHKTAHGTKQAGADSALVEKVAAEVMSRTNLTGGLRRPNGDTPEKLGPEHDETLKKMFEDTGEAPDEKTLAILMETGNPEGTTLEQFEATMSKLGGK
jgi:hypothetical protein